MKRTILVLLASAAAVAACSGEPTVSRAAARLRATLSPGDVTISGPTRVKPNQTCTYTAVVNGGTSPFTFDWLGVNGSTNTQVTTASWSTIGNKAISVDVEDGDATGATGQLGVNVSSSNPGC